jgi:NADH-quinone oxidoreductase subunit F/NADP-reducing hydrogenase subunit HndC
MERLKTIDSLKNLRQRLKEDTFSPEMPRVRICSGTACNATGTPKVLVALEDECRKRGTELDVVKTGCQGLCQKGPVPRSCEMAFDIYGSG